MTDPDIAVHPRGDPLIRRGFTIIELAVSIGILVVVMLAAITVFLYSKSITTISAEHSLAKHGAELMLDLVRADAGGVPNFSDHYVTYGAGALNVVNAAAGAYAERSPLVVLAGCPGEVEAHSGLVLHHQVRHVDSQWRIFREITCDQVRLSDPATAHRVRDEVADVLAYLLQFCAVLDIDPLTALAEKIDRNEHRFPAPED